MSKLYALHSGATHVDAITVVVHATNGRAILTK